LRKKYKMKDLVKTDKKKGKKVGFFNSYILQRISRNKNFICCITGETGSGKSYSTLREGELLDPDFDIRNVCFTPLEFMKLVNGKTKKLKRGSVIIYDEVQVTMSALDFQSLQAKLINACLSTFRFKGFILFMTSPYFQFVNKSARKLFHSRWETVTIDHEKKQCVMKPFLLQTNQETGNTYRKYLRIWTKETGVVPYKRIKVGLASEELRKQYEDRRQRWSNATNEEIEQSLIKAEQKGKPQVKPLTDKQQEIYDMIKDKRTFEEIIKHYNLHPKTIKFHIQYINKKIRYKGEVIKPIQNSNHKIVGFEIKHISLQSKDKGGK